MLALSHYHQTKTCDMGWYKTIKKKKKNLHYLGGETVS